jgi:hypothetical protein
MIRTARQSDRNRVIELLAASRICAGFDRPDGFNFPFDPAYAASLFSYHLANKDAVCIIHDVDGVAQGLLMGTAFSHPYGPVRVSKDSMWFIDPAHRGGTAAVRMLDMFETWARERGCSFGGIVGMGDDPNIKKLLARRGYRVAETVFIKAI